MNLAAASIFMRAWACMSALSVPLFCTDLDPPVPEQQELVPEDQILDDRRHPLSRKTFDSSLGGELFVVHHLQEQPQLDRIVDIPQKCSRLGTLDGQHRHPDLPEQQRVVGAAAATAVGASQQVRHEVETPLVQRLLEGLQALAGRGHSHRLQLGALRFAQLGNVEPTSLELLGKVDLPQHEVDPLPALLGHLRRTGSRRPGRKRPPEPPIQDQPILRNLRTTQQEIANGPPDDRDRLRHAAARQALDHLPSQRIHEHPRRNPVDGSLLDKIGQFPDSQPAPHCFGQQFLLQNQPPLLGRVQPEQDGHGNETREEAA